MTTSISFRPKINIRPSFTQKAEVSQFKTALEQIQADYLNKQTSDIGKMTEQTKLESKIQDSKTEPIKYVEDLKLNPLSKQNETTTLANTDKNFEGIVKNIQNGKQYSLNERENILTNQMNQIAIHNKILHGLY